MSDQPLQNTAPESEPDPNQADAEPCHIGIVVALKQEAGGLMDLMNGAIAIHGKSHVAYEGGLTGRRVVLFQSGPGAKSAQRACQKLIDGHHPKIIISAGFSGGLCDRLKANQIVIADSVATIESEPIDVGAHQRIEKWIESEDVEVGKMLSVDQVVTSPAKKRRLGKQHHAMCVDMESFAVASVCRKRNTQFAAIRIIIDEVEDQLPDDVQHLMDQKSTAGRIGALAGSLFRRPSSAKDIWQLKERSLVASDRLAAFIARIANRLSADNQSE